MKENRRHMETQAKIASEQKRRTERRRIKRQIFLKIILEVGERKTRGKWRIM
jgi:hypothetical protein